MEKDNDKYYYNVKEENGKIVVEKTLKNKDVEKIIDISEDEGKKVVETSNSEKKKRKSNKIVFASFIVLLLIFGVAGFIFFKKINKNESYASRNRTFMIYMTGSDLETNQSMATYDLDDIINSSVDLENNNVVLMVGGSKKWHNFVNEDEVGIYRLTNDGFKKEDIFSKNNMGQDETLTYFLDYVYDKFPSEKYDLIFWDHGLGAVGIEHDEKSDDFLAIFEMDRAFNKSKFADKKLELVIFNNCMAANYQFAKVMSKYADYMVASEEVMYVSLFINRLNFIENVEKDDTGYDIGLSYIEQSDKSMKSANKISNNNLDSTLSILDLSKVNDVDEKLNEFLGTIDLKANLNGIAKSRRKIYTYGESSLDPSYDVVDMYNFIDSLNDYSTNQELGETLKDEIKKMVKYNSSFNSYSTGVSIYFPYYGTSDVVEVHLLSFGQLWNDNYTKFIDEFYETVTSTKKARRAISGSPVNYLKNKIQYSNNTITVPLTSEEKDLYQTANIYIFEKNNDSYKLLLKTDNVQLENNSLKYVHYGFLGIESNNFVTLTEMKNNYKLNASINDSDVISDVTIENGKINMNKVVLDSNNLPSMGYIDVSEEDNISLYAFDYKILENGKLMEDWKDVFEKEKIEYNSNTSDVNIVEGSLKEYYVLVEMYDINNDTFYTELTEIK